MNLSELNHLKMENNIISWITGKSNIDDVSLNELKEIVYRYPYFTLAQLLLTVKMKRDNDPGYAQQLQKTALNFQDPQWLHFRLADLEATLLSKEPTSQTEQNKEAKSTIEEKAPVIQESIPEKTETETSIPEEGPPITNAEPLAIENKDSEEQPSQEKLSGAETQMPQTEDGTNEELSNEETENNIQLEKENTTQPAIPADDTSAPITEDIHTENTPSENNSTPEPAAEEEHPEENAETEKDDKTPDPLSEGLTSRLSSIVAAQAEVLNQEISADQPLPLENPKPLPTKDYFASIGVRVDNTAPNDFSRKVRKFSEWLKQMKRVGPEQLLKETSQQEEQAIIQKADDSNKSAEVLTESMAQILIQQGRKKEAVAILEKLSLLKPDKSAYFASLIDSLKENNN